MTCHAAINQARRPLPRHVLSFGQVTEAQAKRGVRAVCTRCGQEIFVLEQWLEECGGRQHEQSQ